MQESHVKLHGRRRRQQQQQQRNAILVVTGVMTFWLTTYMG